MCAWASDYSIISDHLPPTGKEEAYLIPGISQSHPIQNHANSRRYYETIFKSSDKHAETRAGSKQMSRLEPTNLAEQIIRAVEAGGLANELLEREEISPLQLLGGKIRLLRREMGLELDELAARAKMDTHLLLAIELGAAEPAKVFRYLPALGEALGGRYAELSRLLIHITLHN